jgi:hypothetical protein
MGYQMKKLIILTGIFFIIFSCKDNKNEKQEFDKNIQRLEKNNEKTGVLTEDSKISAGNNTSLLEDFVFYELLNGIKYHEDYKNINGVIETYGNPIKDEIRINHETFYFRGGRINNLALRGEACWFRVELDDMRGSIPIQPTPV